MKPAPEATHKTANKPFFSHTRRQNYTLRNFLFHYVFKSTKILPIMDILVHIGYFEMFVSGRFKWYLTRSLVEVRKTLKNSPLQWKRCLVASCVRMRTTPNHSVTNGTVRWFICSWTRLVFVILQGSFLEILSRTWACTTSTKESTLWSERPPWRWRATGCTSPGTSEYKWLV